MPALNTKRLVGEVASRYGIRLDETDPAFVVVQLTQIALEESSQKLIERMAVERQEFEAAVHKIQNRAGRYVAQEFREGAAGLRREFDAILPRPPCRPQNTARKARLTTIPR
jgi:hypothetical protein